MLDGLTTGTKAARRAASLKLFFLAFLPAFLTTCALLVWKEFAGAVPDIAFYIVYGFVVVCGLVCLAAIASFYIAHFDGEADAT